MGDKSPKSKKREKAQKASAKAHAAVSAKGKQDSYNSGTASPPAKGKQKKG